MIIDNQQNKKSYLLFLNYLFDHTYLFTGILFGRLFVPLFDTGIAGGSGVTRD
jgi:hypothetical protein